MRKIIKYKNLFMILEKQYGFMDAVKFINRIRKFSPQLFDALYEFEHSDAIPQIEILGVSLKELIENEQMTPMEAFIMLDWIEKKPADAFDYMQKYRYSAPLPELSDVQRILVEERIKTLERIHNIPKAEPEPFNEADIERNN